MKFYWLVKQLSIVAGVIGGFFLIDAFAAQVRSGGGGDWQLLAAVILLPSALLFGMLADIGYRVCRYSEPEPDSLKTPPSI